MDEKHFINTFDLFKSTTILGGHSGTAGPFDLREVSRQGKLGLQYTIDAIGASTVGTCSFIYHGCHVLEGDTYIPIGTAGTVTSVTGGSGLLSINPTPFPFIKIIGTMGTSGDHVLTSKFTAYLHVQ